MEFNYDLIENDLRDVYRKIDSTAQTNTARVLDAFCENRVSDAMFQGTTGYGYNDFGRDTLEKIYARVFNTQDALCRINFVNGTHAIVCALFGACTPGCKLLCATGAPYDTIKSSITGEMGLCEYGVEYSEIPMKNGKIDEGALLSEIERTKTDVVFFQRSRGYASRLALSCSELNSIFEKVRALSPETLIVLDNCYGEFTEAEEPRADLLAGSLIKNPGGALAPAGGYIAGKSRLVERSAYRLTVPGIGRECGATFGQNRALFQGFFNAPHVTAGALKTAVFASYLFEKMGYSVSPRFDEPRFDIIQTIELGSADALKKFCAGIQSSSPVDSYVTPEPWAMPGYDCEVIMAAGAFVQGSSIELSADAPMREPYRVYLQGGTPYEAGKLGIIRAAEKIKSAT